MKPEEFAQQLLKSYPAFGKKIIYDVTARGEDFCEIVYPNTVLPTFPITVTVYEDGALLSFGNAEDITGGTRLSLEETSQAIADITEDKTVFSLRYKNSEAYEDGRLSGVELFLLSGDEGDMSEEYEKYLATLNVKPGRLGRLFTSRKGIFRILTFTGKTDIRIER